jgi:DNA-binding NarL/FixJ family response regulator
MDRDPEPDEKVQVKNAEIDFWVVEDSAFFRDTVVELLNERPGLRCTLAAGTCEEAIAALDAGNVPQVVLMDLALPGMSGIEGIRRISQTSPVSRIIVFTIHEDNDRVFEALCAGACGYLLKPATGEEIIAAVDTALGGGAPMNAFIARKVIEMFTGKNRERSNYGLTAREREILQLLVEDRKQKQIAAALSLSPHTIDTHLRNIYAKLQVRSRSGAVAKALQERLL